MKKRSNNIRVAVLALSAKAYGGDSYFQAIIPVLNQYGKDDVKITLFSYNDRYRLLCPKNENFNFIKISFPWLKNNLFRIFWEQIILPFFLFKFDVIYTANNVGILFSPKPCVIAIRNMEPIFHEKFEMSAKHRARSKLLNWLTLSSIKRARRIVAVSHFVKDTLLSKGISEDKVKVIYHGIDDLYLPLSNNSNLNKNDTSYVLSAAKFVRYANLEVLFRAFAKMRSLGYKSNLRFAGGSHDLEYEKRIKILIEKLGIKSSVDFMGYIKREEIQKMMRECDAFLFSSTLEACPFTLLEAMRNGAPIIATTAQPMPEFCGDAAILVNSNDWEGFGEMAFQIASSPEKRQTLRERALKRSLNFKWEDNVRELLETFHEAVNSK